MTDKKKLELLDQIIEYLNSNNSPTKFRCDYTDVLQTIYRLTDDYFELQRRLDEIRERSEW